MCVMLNMVNITNRYIGHWKSFQFQLATKTLTLLLSRLIYIHLNNALMKQLSKLYFPSLATTVHKQLEDYSTHQFVSELGGAAGIVLGVSLFTIIKSKLSDLA